VVDQPDGQRTFIRHLFHPTIKQTPAAYGPETLDQLQKAFVQQEFNIQKILSEIATVAALHGIPTKDKKS